MEVEKIMETLQEVPSDTRVKAWFFQVDNKFYHVATYRGYKIGTRCSVWECNKKGKRTSASEIFTIIGDDHIQCIKDFIAKLTADA